MEQRIQKLILPKQRHMAIHSLSHIESDDQLFPSPSPHITTRMIHSQRSEASGPSRRTDHADDVTFLRLAGVKAMTGLSKSSLYALIREKSFPAPVRLGARTVAWVKSEIRQWAVDRVQASR